MKYLFVILVVLTPTTFVRAQEDVLSQIIEKVFYNKNVYKTVFFEYAGVGEFPHVLASGKYAFIYPDSVFQQHYPDIHDKLSMTWALERKLYTITYLQSPSGTVFIKSNINSDTNLKYFIVFNKIQISKSEARIEFKTSCNCTVNENGIVTLFKVKLIRKGNNWKVKELSEETIKGCR